MAMLVTTRWYIYIYIYREFAVKCSRTPALESPRSVYSAFFSKRHVKKNTTETPETLPPFAKINHTDITIFHRGFGQSYLTVLYWNLEDHPTNRKWLVKPTVTSPLFWVIIWWVIHRLCHWWARQVAASYVAGPFSWRFDIPVDDPGRECHPLLTCNMI